MIKFCSYCGKEWNEENGTCKYCGAPNKLNGIVKYDPFFYDGYIVYSMRNYANRSIEFVFYKGVTLCGMVVVTDEVLSGYNPTHDIMPYVMERLKEL